LLLAHGTPETVDQIPAFLRNVTGGRAVPPEVIEEVERRYALIGRSPLLELTLRQAEGVSRELGLGVYVGMRNWTPYIGDVLAAMQSDGITRAVAICMAPQNSRTSVGLYRDALRCQSGQPIALDFVESWHSHPLLIGAFAEKLRQGWVQACRQAEQQLPVIFTAHSVPLRTIAEGDPYEVQTRETARRTALEVPELAHWTFAFQSQGMSGEPWLGPTVEDTILELKEQGYRGVFVQPIGFLCDHVEVLYDIDIGFKAFAAQQGMGLWRVQSLNDSPTLTAALADLARTRLALQTAGKD
jgi:ferrochelatase